MQANLERNKIGKKIGKVDRKQNLYMIFLISFYKTSISLSFFSRFLAYFCKRESQHNKYIITYFNVKIIDFIVYFLVKVILYEVVFEKIPFTNGIVRNFPDR